jgi:hypothetical protein
VGVNNPKLNDHKLDDEADDVTALCRDVDDLHVMVENDRNDSLKLFFKQLRFLIV